MLLHESNRRFNLTGARDIEDIAAHIVDSLHVLPYVAGPLVDIGAGGGFPGIPLAIAGIRPLTLIEATQKKAAFLRSALETLGVAGEVLAQRAETVGRDVKHREAYAAATARAIGPAATVLELAAPLLRLGGVAALQRGPVNGDEEATLANVAPMLGCSLERVVSIPPHRAILLVLKERPTPERFPRRTGMPGKKPLKVSRET